MDARTHRVSGLKEQERLGPVNPFASHPRPHHIGMLLMHPIGRHGRAENFEDLAGLSFRPVCFKLIGPVAIVHLESGNMICAQNGRESIPRFAISSPGAFGMLCFPNASVCNTTWCKFGPTRIEPRGSSTKDNDMFNIL
jgi:hypothetical protein